MVTQQAKPRRRQVVAIDVLLTVLLPLCIGGALYAFGSSVAWPRWVRHHLADGLWAFSFMSALLILWRRQPHWGWIFAAVGTAVGFEGLQWMGLVAGQGDVLDVVTYVLFFAAALFVNACLRKSYTFNPRL